MRVKKRVVLAVFLIILFVVLLSFNHGRSIPVKSGAPVLDRVVISIYTPVQKGWFAVKNSVLSVWGNYISLIGAKKENKDLKKKLDLKDLQILSLKERLKGHKRAELMEKGLIGFGLEGVDAEVVGYDPYAQSQTIWISAGSDNGVKINQPVMSLKGLVGRVIRVQPSSSQVLLLVDAHFAVDVINERTRLRALVVGDGRRAELERYPLLSHMEYLQLGFEMKAGDLLITSGFSGIYPAGIPVGNIIDVQNGIVLPMFDLSKLEEIVVVTSHPPPPRLRRTGW